MSKEKWDDKEYVLKRVKKDAYALNYASDRLKDDEEVVLTAVQDIGYALDLASIRLKDDKSIVLAAVNQNGRSLEYASDRLKDNEEVVLAVVKQDGNSLLYASDRLRNDINFCITCAKIDRWVITGLGDKTESLFKEHKWDICAVEKYLLSKQQEKENNILLEKLKEKDSFIKTPSNLFKRKIV